MVLNPRNVVDLPVEEYEGYPSTPPSEEEIALKVSNVKIKCMSAKSSKLSVLCILYKYNLQFSRRGYSLRFCLNNIENEYAPIF